MSQIKEAIQHYKAQLAQRIQAAEQALQAAHQNTLDMIQLQLDALYRQIEDAQNAGQDVPASWLYEQNRLQTITDYISGQIDHFAAMAQLQVGNLQYSGVQLGQQSAMALLNTTVPPGVNYSFGVPSPDAIAGMVGATQAGSPLADLFSGFGSEAAQGAKQALISGVTLGQNPRQIAPLIQQALNVSSYRAQTIARTEMLRSYRDANTATFQANSDVVVEWRWTCDKSSRTCAACLGMDGELMDTDETLGSHPNCRCVPVPVTKSWDDILSPLGIDTTGIEDTNPALDLQTGEDWFKEQDAATQQQVLGKAKYEAYADGKFTLKDLVGHSHDEVWGDSIYEKSLKDTLKTANEAPQQAAELPKPREGDILPQGLSEQEQQDWIENYLTDHVPDPLRDSSYFDFEAQAAEHQAHLEAIAEDAEKQYQAALKKQKASEAAKKGAATKAANKAALKAKLEAEAAKAATEAAKEFTPLQGKVPERREYLRENQVQDWLKTLTRQERDAIVEYTGGIYSQMNKMLRGLRHDNYYGSDEAVRAKAELVQSALLKAKAPTDLQNIRGYGNSQLEAFKAALESGDPFIENGFASTTILDKPTFSGFRVIVRIFEGAPGAYIAPISGIPSEEEYLLPYGAELFVVDSFTNPGGDKYTFIVEYRGIQQP